MAKKSASARPAEAPANTGYTVLARRYRPQQFRDLVGQQHLVQSLVNAIKTNRVAHAYLFTGARGVGKTSTARILAKALNCVEGPTPTPCDKCESCRAIAVGEDVDVLEIDGASNNKVEEVRELRQNVQFRPSRSRFKIYIIDEVHMLTPAAFNALLKTLEEPPPHVKFIFATTEVDKVLVTIRSRCQRFDFVGISGKEIAERLREVVTAEGFAAEEEALHLVARRAGGSMRDAESLLDQLLAFGAKELTLAGVHQLLGTADEDRVVAIAGAVLRRDVPAALGLFNDACDQGVQLGELLDQLMEYWRDLLMLKTAGSAFDSFVFPPRSRESMHELAKSLAVDAILAGLDMMAATKTRLRFSSQGRVLMEMLLVRLGRLDDLVSVAELAQRIGGGPSSGSAERPAAATGGSSRAAAPAVANPSYRRVSTDPPKAEGVRASFSGETLAGLWQRAIGQMGMLTAKDLGKSEQAISGPNALVVRFSTTYNKEYERCSQPGVQGKLESLLQAACGAPIAVRFELAGSSSEPARDEPRRAPVRKSELRREAAQVALVQSAVEQLGAQIVHADEGFGAAATSSGSGTAIAKDAAFEEEANENV